MTISERILEVVKKAGAAGITGPQVKKQLGLHDADMSSGFTRLRAAGAVVRQRDGKGYRWFAAELRTSAPLEAPTRPKAAAVSESKPPAPVEVKIAPVELKVPTGVLPGGAFRLMRKLRETGLYGTTDGECVAKLVCERLHELLIDGTLIDRDDARDPSRWAGVTLDEGKESTRGVTLGRVKACTP